MPCEACGDRLAAATAAAYAPLCRSCAGRARPRGDVHADPYPRDAPRPLDGAAAYAPSERVLEED